MDQKQTLTVLVIDRELKEGETAVQHIFRKYESKYGLIMFPPKEGGELVIQTVFFKYKLVRPLEELFNREVDCDPDDLPEFYDLDIYEITVEAFYDVLATKFNLEEKLLTDIEN